MIVPTNSENRVCRSHEKLFIITGVTFLLLFLRISLNACFPTFVYVNKKSSHANCVRIILFSNSSHPFDNSQFSGASYNRVFSRNFQFENLA